MTWTSRAVLGFLAIGTVVAAVMTFALRYPPYATDRTASKTTSSPIEEDVVPDIELYTESLSIRNRDTLSDLLSRAGVDGADRVEMISAVQQAFDVRKLRAGTELTLTRSTSGTLESLEYIIDPDNKLVLSNSNGAYEAAVVEIPGIIRPVTVCATLQGSLFESIGRAGEHPELAIRMAEIFAWDLDFYRDPREGDEFCLLVERKDYITGQPHTYRRILAATYNNAGTIYDAYLFPDEDGTPQYYSHEGRSRRSAFLRSPLKFDARISSHFSHRRLHPVLRVHRPHLGTDYAAPTGTPVYAVASGRVTFSGFSGGAGNLIKIQHSGGYETQYLHLSRRLVNRGQRVAQGQRIGLVGATGLATGPHLDFRVLRNGKHLNFVRLKPPPAANLTAQQMESFGPDRDRYAALMKPDPLAGTSLMASDTPPEPAVSAP